jgi:hypothetical protein
MYGMDGAVFRYGVRARSRDLLVCLLVALLGGGMIAGLLGLGEPEAFLATSGGLLLLVVFVRGRRWVAVERDGLAAGGGSDDPLDRLAWSGLEEIWLFRKGGFAACGDGVELRVHRDIEGANALRDVILRERAPALYRRLRERLRAGEALDFRGPESPSVAGTRALAYLALFVLPPGLTFLGMNASFGFLDLAAGALAVLVRTARACVNVRVDPAGLTVRGLRTRRYPWEELESALFLDDGDLRVQPRRSDAFLLSAEIGNFVVLQELVFDRLAAAKRPG